MAHYDPNVLLLCKKEPLFGNGTQPHQNLGGPQTTMWCFAVQFEDFPQEEANLKRREKGCYFEEYDSFDEKRRNNIC